MFVSPAFAQASGGGGMGGLEPLLPLILIFVVFYFLLIRPQQKKQKAHREMIANVRRGDRVVTAGGVIGQVTRVVDERELMVEIAEGVRVRVMRGMISELLAKSEPARGRDDEEDEKAEKAAGGEDGKKEAKG
jgi:preprotein translocase subunit YajC